MKRVILTTYIKTLLFIVIVSSCNSNDDNTNSNLDNSNLYKLDTVKIYDENNDLSNLISYHYEGNRLIKHIHGSNITTYSYSNDKLISSTSSANNTTVNYEYTDQLITKSSPNNNDSFYVEYYYNSANQMIKSRNFQNNEFTFEVNLIYDNNDNLIELDHPTIASIDYEYDNNNNPYYYGFPIEIVKITTNGKNNIIRQENEFSILTYEYEYNSDNFPIIEKRYENGKLITRIEFTYQYN